MMDRSGGKPNHDGLVRTPSEVIPQPPGAVGELRSVSTDLNAERGGTKVRLWPRRIIMAAFPAFILVSLANAFLVPDSIAWSTRTFLAGIPFFLILLWVIRPRQLCTYVGDRGIALVELLPGGLTGRVKSLRFDEASDLKTRMIRVYDPRQRYRGTSFRYDWRSAEGKMLFSIGGVFRELETATPEPDLASVASLGSDHPLHFAVAAEAAWNDSQAVLANQVT